jgi:hypothetical protein
MSTPQPWWTASWLHFLVLGGVLFALDRAAATDDQDTIVIRASHVAGIQDALELAGEDPTPEAVQAEIDRFVESEVLVREAYRLGLAQGDQIIRRRLKQKMTFLVNDMAEAEPSTEADLQAWLEEHPDRYRIPARYDVTHVFFSQTQRGQGATADAVAALQNTARTGEPPAGDPFLQGGSFSQSTAAQIAQVFGRSFAEELFQNASASDDGWRGPIASPFGQHLVRVRETQPSTHPPLTQVRERVYLDLRDHRRRVASGKALAALLDLYTVQVEEQP